MNLSKTKRIMKLPIIRFVFDRKHIAEKNKKGTVDLVVTYDKQRKYYSTGLRCYPHNWKGDANRNIYVSGTGADVEINQILLDLFKKAYKIVQEQAERGAIDITSIPTLLKSKNVDITFLEYVFKRMEDRKVEAYTHKSYVSFYNKLSEFGRIKFFSDIDEKHIRDFDEWLHAYTWTEKDKYDNDIEKKYSQATIGSYHKNLKAFINDAIVDGYVKENPYSSKRIKIDKGSARTEQYLTLEEIKKIEDTEMPTRSLSEARDLFLFACKTALSYADLMDFDYSKVIDIEGIKIYRSKRHKTLISFSSVITKSAIEILKKYNYRLPKVPNQKYNVKLKLIADAAGIDKPISSHWARRSAAMIWLNEGVPIEVVSKILGHTNMAQTSEYAHVLEKTIIKEITKVVDD